MVRSFLSFALALMLALTSQSMAVARGASAATGQMVLCTGSGPQAVYTDAEGNPTSAPHICPDSALNVLFAVTEPNIAAPSRLALSGVSTHEGDRLRLSLRLKTPRSRAPPLVI